MLTQEQRERLKPYETFLHTAYYGNYTTGIFRKDVLAIFEVYNEARKMHLTEANASCNGCVLEACRWLGMHYFTQEVAEHVTSGLAPDDDIIVEKKEKLTPTGAKTPSSVKHTATKKKTPAKAKKGGKNGKK